MSWRRRGRIRAPERVQVCRFDHRATSHRADESDAITFDEADSFNYSAADGFSCQVNLAGNYVTGSQRFADLNGTTNREEDCAINVSTSTCGGTQTIEYITAGVGAQTNFAGASIDVTFTPWNGIGNQPSILGCLIIIPLAPADARTDAALNE